METTEIHQPSVEQQERRKNRRYTMSLPVTIAPRPAVSQRHVAGRFLGRRVHHLSKLRTTCRQGLNSISRWRCRKSCRGDVEVLVRAHGRRFASIALRETGQARVSPFL